MDYKAALKYLDGLLIKHKDFGLEEPRELMKRMGAYPSAIPTITVAGTNGKGSTVLFASNILIEAGYKVGVYTSPHLIDIRERIRANRTAISKKDFARLLTHAKEACKGMELKPTYFEVMTSVAMKYFLGRKVDVAVLEIGMGGRLDAVNVMNSDVAAITAIGLDHAEFLGNTISKIAQEKAGIIHRESTVVVAKDNAGIDAIRKRVRDFECRIVMPECVAGKDGIDGVSFKMRKPKAIAAMKTKMPGKFQAQNACLAIAAAMELGKKGIFVNEGSIRKGILKTFWPGRMQVVKKKPLVIIDGAHNPHGAEALSSALKAVKRKKTILVFGCLKDKDAFGMLQEYDYDALIVTSPKSGRAYSKAELKRTFAQGEIITPVSSAIRKAMKIAGRDDLVLITGSLYTAGEALKYFGFKAP